MRLPHAAFALALLAAALPARADDTTGTPPAQREHQQISLFLENDLFSKKFGLGKSDRWYTNGVKAVWSYDEQNSAHFMRIFNEKSTRILGAFFGDSPRRGVAFGQLMYTPQNLATPLPQPDDHFYGGWLYVGSVLQNNARFHTRTAELDLGVVGPYSYAAQTQKLVHRTFGYIIPAGWDNQVRGEPGVQLSLNDIERLTDSPWVDTSVYAGATLGTVFDNAKIGAMLRLGEDMDDTPISVIESPVIGGVLKTSGYYFLLKGELEGVAHNTFLDGSFFRPPPFQSNIRRKPLVGQFTAGFVKTGLFGEKVKLSFLLNRRTMEFTSPTVNGKTLFNFGTINVEWAI